LPGAATTTGRAVRALGTFSREERMPSIELPFPDAPMIARAERCIVLRVWVDPNAPDGFLRLDDSLRADVMGTKLRPERKDDTEGRQDRRRARPHHQRRARFAA
jgi:hypothetical protein